jgi:hypothetical protein
MYHLANEAAGNGGFCFREPLLKGRLCTVDLLVTTSFDQLLLIMKTIFTFLPKQATVMRRSTLLILSHQLGFPDLMFVVKTRVNCDLAHKGSSHPKKVINSQKVL